MALGIAITKYKQIIGIAIAAVILSVIFVPFQTADAFTVELDLPNVDDLNEVPTSAVGATFEVTIDVEAGELISVESIELILDNGEDSVKRAIFDSDGQRTSGDSTLTRGNIDIETTGTSNTGYGYGYGFVSDGTTFVPNYEYSFTYSNAFISGNNIGSSNAVGDQVTGIVGPGTITISGKLNTALMEDGVPHTLDVLVNTGTGVNPDHLVAPQLTFTTVGNSSVQNTNVSTGNNVESTPTITGFPPGQFKIKFSQVLTAGDLIIQKSTASSIRQSILDALGINIFSSLSGGNGKFSFGTSSGTTIGDVLDIDASSIEINPGGTYTLTVPYDEDELPNGLAEEDLKLFHFDEDTEEWEDITTDVDTDANTVIGETDSLSPVAVGFDDDDVSADGGGGGGGGNRGGGGGSSVIVNQMFQPSYFIDHPLAKVQVQEATIVTSAGNNVLSGNPGQQLSLMAGFKNYQTVDQDYAIIFQVIDEDGFTSDIGWVTGTLAPGEDTEASRSWTVGAEGNYTVKIFVWNGVSDLPTPLSEVTQKSFTSN
jgi:hypothetical protein